MIQVWQVKPVWINIFFNWFFFQINPSTLGWLRIVLHNLFSFVFYGLSWFHDPGCGLPDCLKVFFPLFNCFQFHPSILSWLSIIFHNLFRFIYMKLCQPHDSSHKFGRLTRVDSSGFFVLFFNWFFFNFII
jgi:hypothetical protein